MLVVTRSAGERVLVGDFGVVTIKRVTGRRVQVGFEFPRDVRVLRAEVLEEGKPDASGEHSEKKK